MCGCISKGRLGIFLPGFYNVQEEKSKGGRQRSELENQFSVSVCAEPFIPYAPGMVGCLAFGGIPEWASWPRNPACSLQFNLLVAHRRGRKEFLALVRIDT